MSATLSTSLQALLSAMDGDPALMDRLGSARLAGSLGGDSQTDDLAALLSELAASGRIPPLHLEASRLAQELQLELEGLLATVQLLTDEQLEAVAAGRMSFGSMLCMVAGSLSLGASDGVALLSASSPLLALGAPMAIEAVYRQGENQTQTLERPSWMAPALEIIKEFEGLELEAYVDAVGVVTIGWGTTRYENGCPVQMGDTISAARAEELLVGSILREYAPGVFDSLPMARTMQPHQQAALISFTYNVGVEALKESTLRKRLVAGEGAEAVIRQELPRWCFGDAGERLAGLVRRRAAEVDLFSAG